MDLWTSHSNPGKQAALAVGCTIVAVILIYGFWDFSEADTNAMAGFFLGVLLAVIGIWSFLTASTQTVTVDPRQRRIIVEDANRFGTKKRMIFFSDIQEIGIGFLGKKTNFVQWYYLTLRLRSGETYPLFSPGRFYEGATNREIVDLWRHRLLKYMGRDEESGEIAM